MFAKIAYPANFPCVSREGYSFSVAAGVLRDDDVQVFPNQRRAYENMPSRYQLQFVLSTAQVEAWTDWMNKHGYDWFSIELVHPWMAPGLQSEAAAVRLISDTISIQYVNWNSIAVQVQVELSPAVYATGYINPDVGAIWIIGGKPSAPSSADWYIAGTPGAPSAGVVIAGTPENPAAYV